MTDLDYMYLKTLLIFVGILAYLVIAFVVWISLGLMKWPPSRPYFMAAVLLWPIGLPWFLWLDHRIHKAMRRDDIFVGQVVDNISDRILTVWNLETGGSYRVVSLESVGIDPNSFPVGSLAHCYLSDDRSFINRMHPVGAHTIAKYKSKLPIPVYR